MSPARERAWARWYSSGVSILNPTDVLDALLVEYERHDELREAVRAFVTSPADSPERIAAFTRLVAMVDP